MPLHGTASEIRKLHQNFALQLTRRWKEFASTQARFRHTCTAPKGAC
jgi:hypothetical protein